MRFNSGAYGPHVAEILALDGNGNRPMPLVSTGCPPPAQVRIKNQKASDLFIRSYDPEAALGGLWLYFSGAEECHQIVQDMETAEGSFWHAILHRQEPDAGNSAYWFRRVGQHPIFARLNSEAERIMERHPGAPFRVRAGWDPFAFIDFCENARAQTGSPSEQAAIAIQLAEWQLLFDYCAREKA